jgi:hypothetical protein
MALLGAVAYVRFRPAPRSVVSVTGHATVLPPSRTEAPPTTVAPAAAPPAATLAPAAPRAEVKTGRLRVVADVPGAAVFLDRKYVGVAPVEMRDVTPGSHRLNVSADGQEMYAETLEVEPGPREIMVRFKEVRLDEAVDVVHRHGVGSCQGRLTATPAGLQYATDRREDAFTKPFADVEPLEVDYLKKNLRVRLRGGKTYNFTTKAESADDLMKFQQKVEAARKRL